MSREVDAAPVARRRLVLHVDLDEFIAAVELLRRPELRGRPVIVGGTGDPRRRGVVATASYEARRFGVDSGMPLATAARRCPDAVFLPLDLPAYEAASERVLAVLRSFPGTWEEAGWDEAFAELEADDPVAVAHAIQRAVLEATGLRCSVGIGENKLHAKAASGLAKPAGVFRLDRESWPAVMGARPTDALSGIGRKRRKRLAELGIHTVGDLASADENRLARTFGPRLGPWLSRLARGEDDTPVLAEPRPSRSHGHERTFERDLRDAEGVRREVEALARAVAADLERAGWIAERVVVTVRYADFETHDHGERVEGAGPAALVEAALLALAPFELEQPVRLVGVRAERRVREPLPDATTAS